MIPTACFLPAYKLLVLSAGDSGTTWFYEDRQQVSGSFLQAAARSSAHVSWIRAPIGHAGIFDAWLGLQATPSRLISGNLRSHFSSESWCSGIHNFAHKTSFRISLSFPCNGAGLLSLTIGTHRTCSIAHSRLSLPDPFFRRLKKDT